MRCLLATTVILCLACGGGDAREAPTGQPAEKVVEAPTGEPAEMAVEAPTGGPAVTTGMQCCVHPDPECQEVTGASPVQFTDETECRTNYGGRYGPCPDALCCVASDGKTLTEVTPSTPACAGRLVAKSCEAVRKYLTGRAE